MASSNLKSRPEPLLRELAHFLGPMAENSELFVQLLNQIIDDHHHWRRNYYPSDASLITSRDRRTLWEETDALREELRDLLAKLRRSFPFHSPRYIAHQQSETSMPALLGAIAGLLYNANNVTSQSGNATIQMELEAAAALMEMVGYTPPPQPPDLPVTKEELDEYGAALSQPYAWGHLCSGGTSANLEALWVARNVRQRTVALVLAASELGLSVPFRDVTGKDVTTLDGLSIDQLLRLRPEVAINLATALFVAAAEANRSDDFQAAIRAHIADPPDTLRRDRPLVFASGAAHYSIRKALDVLGLDGSLVAVNTLPNFRLDVADLRRKMESNKGRPLAVVAVIGTTEEGAVDPLHEILEFRTEWERVHGQSFWVHADAAWGGYFASALRPAPRDEFVVALNGMISSHRRRLDADGTLTPEELPELAPNLDNLDRLLATLVRLPGRSLVGADVDRLTTRIRTSCRAGRWADARSNVIELMGVLGHAVTGHSRARLDLAADFLVGSDAHEAWRGPRARPLGSGVPQFDNAVLEALDALPNADSVTVDPHKMGFQPYACGAILFRLDTRELVRQEAPYITGVTGRGQTQPLIHLKESTGGHRGMVRVTEAPAVFTLEGSRPSGPAAGLWLSTRLMPLDRSGHARLVRATWRAANTFFAMLDTFDPAPLDDGTDGSFEVGFEVLTRADGRASAPDTNLVIFGIRIVDPSTPMTLELYNSLVDAVYRKFSILAEDGDERASYSQPMFLSKTAFDAINYHVEAVRPSAKALGITDLDASYSTKKMQVLRATIMNPYLESAASRADNGGQLAEAVNLLYQASVDVWQQLRM